MARTLSFLRVAVTTTSSIACGAGGRAAPGLAGAVWPRAVWAYSRQEVSAVPTIHLRLTAPMQIPRRRLRPIAPPLLDRCQVGAVGGPATQPPPSVAAGGSMI